MPYDHIDAYKICLKEPEVRFTEAMASIRYTDIW